MSRILSLAGSPQAENVRPERTNPAFGKAWVDRMTIHELFPDYDRSELYRTEAEHDRINQLVKQIRKEAWQYRVKAFCVAVAGLSAVYFAVEMFR